VLGQEAVDEKRIEVTTVPEPLKMLDIQGAFVTVDALNTQTPVATFFTNLRGGPNSSTNVVSTRSSAPLGVPPDSHSHIMAEIRNTADPTQRFNEKDVDPMRSNRGMASGIAPSVACLKESRNLALLRSGEVRPQSHVHHDGFPLGVAVTLRRTYVVAARAVVCPELSAALRR